MEAVESEPGLHSLIIVYQVLEITDSAACKLLPVQQIDGRWKVLGAFLELIEIARTVCRKGLLPPPQAAIKDETSC